MRPRYAHTLSGSREAEHLDPITADTAPPRQIQALRAVPAFKGLSDGALAALAASMNARSCRKGTLVLKPGDEGRVVVIARGLARLYRVSSAGKEVTLRDCRPGDIVGLAYLDPTIEPREFLEAMIDGTEVHSMARRHFERVIASSPPLALSVLRMLALNLQSSRDHIEDLALYSMNARVARALIRLSEEQRSRTVIVTHRELAWMIAARQEEVTKVLSQFRGLGFISYKAHQPGITILDMNALADQGDGVAR